MGGCMGIVDGSPVAPVGANGVRHGFTLGTDYNGVLNSGAATPGMRCRVVTGTGDHYFTWNIGLDYASLVGVFLVGVADATVAGVDIDLKTAYGQAGQAFATHAEQDLTSTYNLTSGLITEIDLTGIYSSLAAGDYCGLWVDHNSIGTTVRYLGIRWAYNAT